jgi:acyl-coenzyme A synthetase/AMP-(fatty) acid ligase/acyl carrier protein
LGPSVAAGASFASVSSITTDLGNTAVFPSLLSGGTLHLVSPETSMHAESLSAYMKANPIDVLKITPSHLSALLSSESEPLLPKKVLVLGGEALSWELVDRVQARSACRILNHYGPTETTVGSCTYEVGPTSDRTSATVPIGRPLPNTTAYVLDGRLAPLPVGVTGELFIGGAGVALGYVGREDETASRFLPDPFTTGPSARMYRTGDRVRMLADGSLEFLGRTDDQVKVRGYRVEPGEVEAVLERHEAVKLAAVVAAADDEGEARLLAYVVADATVSVEGLRRHLQAALPEYMVPARLAIVPDLPLTPSGKIDRQLLASRELAESERTAAYVAPRDVLEEEIAAIWSEVLRRDRVGVGDDFFELGGHSLKATQVMARVRSRYDLDVPFQTIFEQPTVSGIADAVRRLQKEVEDEEVEQIAADLGRLPREQAEVLLAGDHDERP